MHSGGSEAASGSDADISESDDDGDASHGESDLTADDSGSERGGSDAGEGEEGEEGAEVEVLSSDDEPPLPDGYYSEVLSCFQRSKVKLLCPRSWPPTRALHQSALRQPLMRIIPSLRSFLCALGNSRLMMSWRVARSRHVQNGSRPVLNLPTNLCARTRQSRRWQKLVGPGLQITPVLNFAASRRERRRMAAALVRRFKARDQVQQNFQTFAAQPALFRLCRRA